MFGEKNSLLSIRSESIYVSIPLIVIIRMRITEFIRAILRAPTLEFWQHLNAIPFAYH